MKGWNWSTVIVATLSGLSGGAASLVGAVSLTRVAQLQLGFPDPLPWTFTAAADIGAVAGAIIWTVSAPRTPARRTGVRLNLFCLSMSSLCVGADHASHADKTWIGWAALAFLVGAFMPLLGSWMVHGLAKMRWPETAVEQTVEQQAPAPMVTVAEAVEQIEQKPPVLVNLDKKQVPRTTQTSEIAQRRATSGSATDWAREEWPVNARQIMDAHGIHKGSAHRIVKKIEAEKRREAAS